MSSTYAYMYIHVYVLPGAYARRLISSWYYIHYWQGCIQAGGGAKSGFLLIRVGDDELFDK